MKREDIISEINELPPISSVVTKLLELLNNPNSSTEDIIKTVTLDTALTTKLLKLCNSPFYGFSKEVTSVNRAVILLGRNTLINLVVSVCSSDQFDHSQNGYRLQQGDLWKHSVVSAFASQLVAQKIGYKDNNLLFTSCLLQDIGKLILDNFIENKISMIVKKIKENNRPFYEIEKEVLGYHHGEVGAIVLKNWNFPDVIIDAVEYHHEPGKAKIDKELVYLMQLSEYICSVLGIGVGIDGLYYDVDMNGLLKYKLSKMDIQEMLIILVGQMDKINDFLSL